MLRPVEIAEINRRGVWLYRLLPAKAFLTNHEGDTIRTGSILSFSKSRSPVITKSGGGTDAATATIGRSFGSRICT